MKSNGIAEPLRFAAALADGEHLHVFRLASDGKPPSLYVNTGAKGTVVASEPLDDKDGDWRLMPAGGVLTLDRAGRVVEDEALATCA